MTIKERTIIRSAWPGSMFLAALGFLVPMLSHAQVSPGRFRDCQACPEMVVVSSGRFMMGEPPFEISGYREGAGDARPYHEVIMSHAFAIGVYEVTFDEWDACVSDGGCGGYRPDDEGWGRGHRPVINVSWKDAKSYASWLSRKTGEQYRLPSEAEWEYVARAGTHFLYFFGNDRGLLCQFANGLDDSVSGRPIGVLSGKNCDCNDGSGPRTMPVGSYRPNPFGLYDILGNVGEWVEDMYVGGAGYVGAPADGSPWLQQKRLFRCFLAGGWKEGDQCRLHVVRGGDWAAPPAGLTTFSRRWNHEDARMNTIGFRVVRDMKGRSP